MDTGKCRSRNSHSKSAIKLFTSPTPIISSTSSRASGSMRRFRIGGLRRSSQSPGENITELRMPPNFATLLVHRAPTDIAPASMSVATKASPGG
jgi:hypothetical protein